MCANLRLNLVQNANTSHCSSKCHEVAGNHDYCWDGMVIGYSDISYNEYVRLFYDISVSFWLEFGILLQSVCVTKVNRKYAKITTFHF